VELVERAPIKSGGHRIAQRSLLAFTLQWARVADFEAEPIIEVERLDSGQRFVEVIDGRPPVGVGVASAADV
jgi:hypothetical protein